MTMVTTDFARTVRLAEYACVQLFASIPPIHETLLQGQLRSQHASDARKNESHEV